MSDAHYRFSGPKTWILSTIAGALLGWLLMLAMPPKLDPAGIPEVPVFLVLPFAILLVLIAAMPLVNPHFWHAYFPDAAFLFGSIVVSYYLGGYGAAGRAQLLHAAHEYYSFIALVGGLYVVSGGILTEFRGKGRPWSNTLILGVGAVIANLVGTTGASVLLIRPFMRFNQGRLRPIHIVFFIFIVSNCGGCLTPIGDPPLYLGYLKGVPFFWTATNLSVDWALTVGILLAMYFVVDSVIEKKIGASAEGQAAARSEPTPKTTGASPVSVRGTVGLCGLVLVVSGVFIDPLLRNVSAVAHIPLGATFQIIVAVSAYFLSSRDNYRANEFSFFPVKEVGLLFLGIFATMVPALGYLAAHGPELAIKTPTQFYFLTGTLSAVLDNAPTYMNFVQLAVGDAELTREVVRSRLLTGDGAQLLVAISTGAVFFGAMTYIGNGPNFMVRSIAESGGVKMPSFFGYLLRAVVLLLPVLIIHWLVLIA